MSSYAGAFGPVMSISGTPGQAANIVEATLVANQQQQEIASRPLKVPDLREFGLGRRVNITG